MYRLAGNPWIAFKECLPLFGLGSGSLTLQGCGVFAQKEDHVLRARRKFSSCPRRFSLVAWFAAQLPLVASLYPKNAWADSSVAPRAVDDALKLWARAHKECKS